MTSVPTHKETVQYFADNKNFGLGKDDVFFFQQPMVYALDDNGKLLLQTKSEIVEAPNGNGGELWPARFVARPQLHSSVRLFPDMVVFTLCQAFTRPLSTLALSPT